MTEPITVAVDRIAVGGTAIGTAPDGRIAFVTGAIPGERVLAEITKEKKSLIEATALRILDSSSDRQTPPCAHVADGCGGCDWQHIASARQSDLRRETVADALRRLAKIDNVDVRSGPVLPVDGYRTTVRAAVLNGRAGFRRAGSHDIVTPDSCLTAHPLAEEILVDGRFPGAREISIDVGARTGERMVMVAPTAEEVVVPDDVLVVGRDEIRGGRLAFIHEEVAGHRFRISAGSFFQCRPDGAEALVDLVGAAMGDTDGPVVDAYAGVGLFGALLAGGRPLTSIESNPSSSADAAENLPPGATIVKANVEKWQATACTTVIADPARRGLESKGAAALVATGADRFVLVSCDPASLARDASLLVDAGYALDHVTVVDLFGQTSHVEAVSQFSRT